MANTESKRNLVRQEVALKDGTVKAIFHQKKFHGSQYGSHAEWWKQINMAPKYNSKRQQKLREQKTA